MWQTLHAIYGKRCLPAIESRIRAGNRQVIGFFEDVRIREIDEPEIRIWDRNLRSFFNANTPEALAQASVIAIGGEHIVGESRSYDALCAEDRLAETTGEENDG